MHRKVGKQNEKHSEIEYAVNAEFRETEKLEMNLNPWHEFSCLGISNLSQYIFQAQSVIMEGMRMRILEIRSKKNISLTELSKRTGISKSALNYYENGIRFPNMLQMEKIAAALGTSISNLFESPYK